MRRLTSAGLTGLRLLRLGTDHVSSWALITCSHSVRRITPTGQISRHSAQPVQRLSSTRSVPPAGRIACSGQVSRHAPHPWQAPMITAAIFSPTESPTTEIYTLSLHDALPLRR